ncbi:MAG TPA: PadR family transcriptional regulator [Acidobacteriota bacterium]|nr:PadR family transcriptional regulator [Acidobacteriota bacterium]
MTDSDRPRLSVPGFHILLALADGSRHGYGIMTEVEERSEGRFRLWPATLYGAIKRMVAEELIEPRQGPDGEDTRRNYYRLTDLGREVLAEETRRMDDLVELARAKKVLSWKQSR